jgi:hypothetical protein
MQLFKDMIEWFKYKPESGYCGGVECCEIVGRFGKKTGQKIYYNRPDSDTKITYNYDYEHIVTSDTKLKQISKQANQFADMAKRLITLIFVPYAEKIFNRCEGFVDGSNKPLEKRKPEEQFHLLKKYYGYYFADLCREAFVITTKVKKKG